MKHNAPQSRHQSISDGMPNPHWIDAGPGVILTGSRLLPISADGSERPCEVLIGCIMSARIAGSRGLHWYKHYARAYGNSAIEMS